MKKNNIINSIKILGLISVTLIYSCNKLPEKYTETDKLPQIFPDYTDVVIPPNIAPLNFNIEEQGKSYVIDIYGKNGEKIVLKQNSPSVSIPIDKWKKITGLNKGSELYFDIYILNDKNWVKYRTITNNIAEEPIDSYLAYRLINAVYIFWRKMGIYQRNIENFDETPIFENTSSDFGCVNCHSFSMNNPEKMSMHFRKAYPGTVILDDNIIRKINTKTDFTMSACVYPSWHPDGNHIAYSVNLINQSFTSDKTKLDEVVDKASDIVVYNVKTNTLTTSPYISTKDRENIPAWSPDGKWLYYITAPENKKTIESWYDVKYSLMRIPYDVENNEWGIPDTVLSSKKTGLSITFPRISPDGKYVMFCMIDHGYFSIYDVKSDLYILDLEKNEYKKVEVSGPYNESYHSWSNSGRWFVFASKRLDNVYSRPFISYFDKDGIAHKAFVLPQKDPLFYKAFLKNYNIPELIYGKVPLNARQMRDIVHKEAEYINFDPSVNTDALSGATMMNVH